MTEVTVQISLEVLAEIRDVLKEVAEDLQHELESKAGIEPRSSSIQRKLDRDLEPANRALILVDYIDSQGYHFEVVYK